jgi:membrane-associated phospholipid phosphatase
VREKLLDIWPIWKFTIARKTSIGFLLSMAAINSLILSPSYLITNHIMGWRGTTALDPTTSWDLAVPFMAWTIVIYLSLFYFFYPLPLISMPDNKRGRQEALIMSQSLIVLYAVSNIWFVICPAEVHIRSQALENVDTMHPVFLAMFEGLWFMDEPYNAWPSLHVSSALLFTLFAIRWWKDKPIRQWAVGIWWILMALSILTTKQHFILDMITGALIIVPLWKWQIQPSLDRLDRESIEEVAS